MDGYRCFFPLLFSPRRPSFSAHGFVPQDPFWPWLRLSPAKELREPGPKYTTVGGLAQRYLVRNESLGGTNP
ncbi:hypothetical protein CTA1_8320 [Colletotrichum tanaceti]|uniref:Uncharacterized protein n=1 Tax=Colletotrichum tanaceti TaxID=1306861 RepID=A0A4U6X4E5_9PEZI|nr:hypothetical protein CTA1_8320 [Colletotrichum tanaceti]